MEILEISRTIKQTKNVSEAQQEVMSCSELVTSFPVCSGLLSLTFCHRSTTANIIKFLGVSGNVDRNTVSSFHMYIVLRYLYCLNFILEVRTQTVFMTLSLADMLFVICAIKIQTCHNSFLIYFAVFGQRLPVTC